MTGLVPLVLAGPDIGAKASRLAELAAAGFPVPRTYVAAGLDGTAPIDTYRADVERVLAEDFAGRKVVVRSSASDEDHPAAVAPGVYETLMGLDTADDVLSGLRYCVASLNTEDARAYRAMHRVDARPSMSVMIQEVVACDISGVLYTRSPVSERAVMLVQWKDGLGTEVVAGTSTARLVELSRAHVAEGMPSSWTFDDSGPWALLAQLGLLLEERYGGPQDVEWGCAGSHLYVFQSRSASLGTVPPTPWIDRPGVDGGRHEVISRGYAIGRARAVRGSAQEGPPVRAAAPSIALVDELPSAQGVQRLLGLDGVILRRATVLSHAAAMVREVGLPAISVGEQFDDLRLDETYLLDALGGALLPLASLPPVDRKKAVFAWARHRALSGRHPHTRIDDKYEGVIFDPVAQQRLTRRVRERGGAWRTTVQQIFPFDFPERVYCGIGARIQHDRATDATKVQFKYARPLPDRPYRFDQEVAVDVDDADEGRDLLRSLGYLEYDTQERRIQEHNPEDGVRVCINEWPGAAHPYVGVEGRTSSQIDRVLHDLEAPAGSVHPLDGKDLFALLNLRLDSLTFVLNEVTRA